MLRYDVPREIIQNQQRQEKKKQLKLKDMSVSTSNTTSAQRQAQAIRSHLCDKQTQKNKRGTGQLTFAGELLKKNPLKRRVLTTYFGNS